LEQQVRRAIATVDQHRERTRIKAETTRTAHKRRPDRDSRMDVPEPPQRRHLSRHPGRQKHPSKPQRRRKQQAQQSKDYRLLTESPTQPRQGSPGMNFTEKATLTIDGKGKKLETEDPPQIIRTPGPSSLHKGRGGIKLDDLSTIVPQFDQPSTKKTSKNSTTC